MGTPSPPAAHTCYTRSGARLDSGAKALIESHSADVAQIEFEKGAIDVDTPADFERIETGG